ncbi:MAG: hypothetical protein K0A99_08395 [Desulfoarculaceae bacterium]|nr:hypothetical protein [Desulfoarculaceae bacterium]
MMISKKSILYLSAILIFIIYLFSADYIFNVLIKTDQEARLAQISLLPETQNIIFAIDEARPVKLEWKDAFFISGWVFKKGVKERNRDVYLVLKGKNNTLIFDIEKDLLFRGDVTKALKLGGDINAHGFELTVATYFLKEDSYKIGFVIDDSTGKYYHNSNQALVKNNGTWSVPGTAGSSQKQFISEKKLIPVKASNNLVQHYIDSLDVADETITVSGWGYLDGLHADHTNHYIIFLKKGDDLVIFDTEGRNRADVTFNFKDSGLNLDSSGFFARIPAGKLQKGIYQIGLYLVKGEKQGLVFSDKYLDVKDGSTVRVITKVEYEKL